MSYKQFKTQCFPKFFIRTLLMAKGNKASHQESGDSQVALVVKNPSANAGDIRDTGLIPESGRSPGEGNGSNRFLL